jgi:hypothetical protein
MIVITDKFMLKKMQRALKMANDTFDLNDIADGLRKGTMQGFVVGDTWAVTQVHQWPRRKSVNILVVVGNLDESLELETKITNWAKDIGADHITAIGRDGWWEHRTHGWKKLGVMYSKDI